MEIGGGVSYVYQVILKSVLLHEGLERHGGDAAASM